MSYLENSRSGCKYTSSIWALTETLTAPGLWNSLLPGLVGFSDLFFSFSTIENHSPSSASGSSIHHTMSLPIKTSFSCTFTPVHLIVHHSIFNLTDTHL